MSLRTLLSALVLSLVLQQTLLVAQSEILEITEDTVLEPSRTYGSLRIKASNVTVDGRGAWLIGETEGNPAKFQGTAILGEGVSHVTLKNVNARGWETGLIVRDGTHWTIQGCDFSDNFHDPRFGWGENGRRGGILLERVRHSTLLKNRTNRVWDGCVLVDSHENRLQHNDFSHTSNTCLKLWNSIENFVVDNNLNYGIRIDPGEVHARDSTCVLLESGSNNNRFLRNDCTHGGDGIFIRVLNGWVSTGNVFEENDCSYANNNCVEAWAPRNVYIRNKANHGSYGFWLGASDQTRLIDNEASFNGLPDGNHNSPHLPNGGHAGIVFMFGPSSHTVVRGNTCIGNHGAGIAAIGDLGTQGKKWRAYHWIIEQNDMENNRWGIYLQHADWINVAANRFQNNAVADVYEAGNVTRLTRRDVAKAAGPPVARLQGPSIARVDRATGWDAAASRAPGGQKLAYYWDMGDGTRYRTPSVEHIYRQAGFYRLGLTVDNGTLTDLAFRDVYVTDDAPEVGTEESPDNWSWIDPASRCRFMSDTDVYLQGTRSLHATVHPYSGGRVTLVYRLPDEALAVSRKSSIAFWLKTRNPNTPAWQNENPIVTLVDVSGESLALKPQGDFLSNPPYNEAREGWTYFIVPLAGNDDWKLIGTKIGPVRELRFGFDSWGAPPLDIWLDGVAFLAKGE